MVKNRGIGWEVLHVCIDDAQRLAYTEATADERKRAPSPSSTARASPGSPLSASAWNVS